MTVLALQESVYQALSADMDLMAMVAGVYNHVPQDVAVPYVVIGEMRSLDRSTVEQVAAEIDMQLHIFSRHRGTKEALAILQQVKAILHRADLVLDGANLVYLYFNNSNLRKLSDGLTWQVTLLFSALVEEV